MNFIDIYNANDSFEVHGATLSYLPSLIGAVTFIISNLHMGCQIDESLSFLCLEAGWTV